MIKHNYINMIASQWRIWSTMACLAFTSQSFAHEDDVKYQDAFNSAAVNAFVDKMGGAATLKLNETTGTPSLVRMGRQPVSAFAIKGTDAQDVARKFFTENGAMYGITDFSEELVETGRSSVVNGITRITYQQMHDGMMVIGGEVIVNVNNDGNTLNSVIATYLADVHPPSHHPDITPEQAIESALVFLIKKEGRVREDMFTGQPELVVYNAGISGRFKDETALAYRVFVAEPKGSKRNYVFVDALTGNALKSLSLTHDVSDRLVMETSEDLVNVALENWFKITGEEPYTLTFSGIDVTWKEGDPFPTGNGPRDRVVEHSRSVYNLFKNATLDQWLGPDNNDSSMETLIMHENTSGLSPVCPNAFSTTAVEFNYVTGYVSRERQVVAFCSDISSVDTVGHEWSHGYSAEIVNPASGGLIYEYQSGALNESYADVIGQLIEIQTFGPRAPRVDTSCSTKMSSPSYSTLAPSNLWDIKDAPPAGILVARGMFGPGSQVSEKSFPARINQEITVNGPLSAGLAVELVNDGSAIVTDLCEALPAGSLAGRVALIQTGGCSPDIKALNARAAGASAFILYDAEGNDDELRRRRGFYSQTDLQGMLVIKEDGDHLKAALEKGPLQVDFTFHPDIPARYTGNFTAWQLGVDDPGFEGAIRDMWDPSCGAAPGKISELSCFPGNIDGGGVHVNSGISNHAAALLIAGGSYNGTTVPALGPNKVAKLYVMSEFYLTSSASFAEHADALASACSDLIGSPVRDTKTGAVVDTIVAHDCTAIELAMHAVEMRAPISTCTSKVLEPNPPALCEANTALVNIFQENFENPFSLASSNWTQFNNAALPYPSYPDWLHNWTEVAAPDLPEGVPGKALFYDGEDIFYPESCRSLAPPTSDVTYLISPEVNITGRGQQDLRIAFDHNIAAEYLFDGGVMFYRVGDGASFGPWLYMEDSQFVFNGYDDYPLSSVTQLGDYKAWTGVNDQSSHGSWGQSQAIIPAPGQAATRLQFAWAYQQDFCYGLPGQGWYVDNVSVYQCDGGKKGQKAVAKAQKKAEKAYQKLRKNYKDWVSSGPDASGTKTIKLVGRGERILLHGTTDVFAHGNFAYIGTYIPKCSDGGNINDSGVIVFDTTDKTNPKKIGAIPGAQWTRQNDVKVKRMRNSGQNILISSNEACQPRWWGGFNIYNVDDPRNPVLYGTAYMEDPNPNWDAFFEMVPKHEQFYVPPDQSFRLLFDVGVHNTYLFSQGTRDLVAVMSESIMGQLQIWDITNPQAPFLAGLWGQEFACPPEICPFTTPNPYEETDYDALHGLMYDFYNGGYGRSSPIRYLHDFYISDDGMRAYLAYWDLGLVLLDISDLSQPRIISIALPDVSDPSIEVNSHSVWVTADGKTAVEGDEDFAIRRPGDRENPRQLSIIENSKMPPNAVPMVFTTYVFGNEFLANSLGNQATLTVTDQPRVDVSITGGPLAGAVHPSFETQGNQPGIAEDFGGSLSGELVYVGTACKGEALLNPVAGKIAVVQSSQANEACNDYNVMKSVADAGAIAMVMFDQDPGGWGGIRIWDYSDPAHPILASTFHTLCSANPWDPSCDPRKIYSVHNVIIEGKTAFISWYGDGVVVLDISDPYHPVEIARFASSSPEFEAQNGGLEDGRGLQDVWGVYKIPGEPYVYASDRNGGLYILQVVDKNNGGSGPKNDKGKKK